MAPKREKIAYIKQLLESKQLSCRELTQTFLDSIRRDNEKLNAYVTVTEKEAMEAADRVDRKIQEQIPLLPLEGIPMTLKDNISTCGIRTTCCSKMLLEYVPIYDATIWSLLKKQNTILLGKSNMDEFAMGSSCQTSIFGGALNPHHLGYVAGGSSGGTASAVGGNLAVFGLGSDTGGSIRQPASFCGVVGLKPTYGAVSRYGLIAFASSFDQIGPIASSVEDVALVYDAISQKDEKDTTCRGRGDSPASGRLNKSIKGMKIGVAKEFVEEASGETRSILTRNIQIFEELGAEIIELSLPIIKYALPIYYILACAEASSNLGRYDGIRYGFKAKGYENIDEMICKTRAEGFGQEVKRRILLGTYVLSAGYYDAYYRKAQEMRGAVVKAFREAFCHCDLLVSATTPCTAFKRGFHTSDPTRPYESDICTVPVNIAGLPAISVPAGFDGVGMPVGMQLIGNHFCEGDILRAAYQFEQATEDACFRSTGMGVAL